MADEWVLTDRMEDPIDYVVADATGIEKGALLKLTNSGTAILATAAGDMCAGIAAREKVASDGRTQLAVFRRGIFDMVASGAILVGAAVTACETANHVLSAAVTASGAAIIGHALETAAADEVIQIAVNVGAGGNQVS